MSSWDHSHHILTRTSHEKFGVLESYFVFYFKWVEKHPCTYQHQARRLAVLMRTTCPHEDRLICPRPHPQGLLQYTVLVLVLSIRALKVLVLVLVLKDRWTVLVPSLITILCQSGLFTFGQGDLHFRQGCLQDYQQIFPSFLHWLVYWCYYAYWIFQSIQ